MLAQILVVEDDPHLGPLLKEYLSADYQVHHAATLKDAQAWLGTHSPQLILLDEADKTVKMYEKTTETSAGVSFGASAETSFQSGSTLFRKVKSVQYGPEGKVFEYNFDLGAIPKAVKTAAQAAGWKFKTVILKKNAMR